MNTALINKLLEKSRAERQKGDFSRAFEFSKKALVFGQKQLLFKEINDVLIEIGLTYKQKSIAQNEVQYLDEAVIHFNTVLEKDFLSQKERLVLLHEVGKSYHDFGKNTIAHDFYQRALSCADEFPSEQVQILLNLHDLANKIQDLDEVISCLTKAERIIETNTIETILVIQVFQNIADYYVAQTNFTLISEYAQKVLSLARSEKNGFYESKALNTAAIPYAVNGDYKVAFEYMYAALEISESLDLRKITASTLVNIGNIFAALYSYEEAIKNYKRVLDNYRQELNPESVGITYFNLGSAYKALEDLNHAESCYKKALEIGQKLEYKLLISRIYFELVQIYILRNDLDTAIAYSFEAEKIYPKEGNQPSIETYMANQCQLSYLRKEYDTALEYGNKAIFYCIRQNNLKTLKRTYKAMADVCKALKNYEEAVYYLEKFNATSEEFMLQMRQRRTIDLEIQYAIKDKENEIERLQQELELDKVKLQYQEEITVQNNKLKMSNEALRQFTYAISHDLKEPLRMISSFSNIWYKRHKNTMDETDEEYFKYIKNGSIRMANMLQGLLEFATIGQKAQAKTQVDMNKIVADIRTILYVKIQENEAVFEVGQLPTIETHRVLLFQLMQNLISNAIKFKKTEIPPIIKIKCKTEEKRYVISVMDNGIGIEEKHLDTIFKIFKRLHTNDEYEGTGIGLSLCQKITHHLNGKLWVESKIGEGSTFYFSLPL